MSSRKNSETDLGNTQIFVKQATMFPEDSPPIISFNQTHTKMPSMDSRDGNQKLTTFAKRKFSNASKSLYFDHDDQDSSRGSSRN